MASRSSSDHPESSHPYHANRSRSTTSLESRKEGRFSLRRLLPSSQREGLLPLPEGARLSSSSPPPVLPMLPHMSLELPHPARTPDSPHTPGDSTWATTPDPSPQPPVMILGVTGTPLHHPQPRSIPTSSGITSIFPTAPTSPPTAVPQTTEHHPQQATETLPHGTSPIQNWELTPEPVPTVEEPVASSSTAHLYPAKIWILAECPGAAHAMLLESSPMSYHLGATLPPTQRAATAATRVTCDLRPLSRDSEIGQARQAAQTPLTVPVQQPPSPCSSSTGFQNHLSRPPSRHAMTPINLHSHLCSALLLYEQTRFDDILFPALRILTQAEYTELYSYFAYELPFMPTWGTTQASNDYFMKKQQGLPADKILQYEAEQNARLLFNELHPDAPMRTLTPYEEATAEIEVQKPMSDEPPVAPPWTTIGIFSYIRGQEPPGTNTHSYRPFTGANPPGRPPAQPPQPPAPIRWVLPCHPAPPKAPTPPVPWVLTNGNVASYDDFKGDSNDISRFFLKCELHFKLFNRHFRYPPPQSHLLHLVTRWQRREMVGTVCQTHRKNRRWGTAIPHLWRFQNKSQGKVLEGCGWADQVHTVGEAQTGQLLGQRPVLPTIWRTCLLCRDTRQRAGDDHPDQESHPRNE